MPNIGVSELIVILLILMLVFGASRLPKLGESMGKAISNFKRAVSSNEDIAVSEVERKRLQEKKAGTEVTDAEVVDEKQSS
ncbi:MAG TPA: twin-arginine translocase TatA/TatE family subunit [Polyangiales bacterium]|nr:twin-arginine translocase TatA/TatE family subunit [Polyangiales bacterium]